MSEQETKINIEDIDENMRCKKDTGTQYKWLNPLELPFHISGFPWLFSDKVYRRLPVKSEYKIPENVNILANCTSGGQIRFRTNTKKLPIKVLLSDNSNMAHMPATGQSGFDCYIGGPGKQLYRSTTIFKPDDTSYECVLFEQKEPVLQNVTLNFPLYQGVKEVLIGIEKDSEVFAPPPFRSDKRIIFYGTSITQGGCASRPGMAYTNIISRLLNIECINLGFSGNGRGEPEMAKIISEIEKPACIVLDYEANVDKELLHNTLPGFVRILRSVHPKVPILVVSKIPYAVNYFDESAFKLYVEMKEFQRNTVEEFNADGDGYIFFLDGSRLLGSNPGECTVDGVHPTDLGFKHMADVFVPVIERLLNGDIP